MEIAYLKVSDIAKMTGVGVEVVRRWCRSGKLKAYRPGGKDLLVKRSDFEAFMEANVCKEE